MAKGKYLVIIEAPGKLKKFKAYLGSDYEVLATIGHIKDLPEKELGVDIKNSFEATYEVYPDKKDLVKNLISQASKSDLVYLFTDDDREGEKISESVASILPKGTKYKRAKANKITKEAIMKGIENAGNINKDLVDASEARRILDRLAGYKTSYITKMATGGTSAGRVQSAALRLLAELEKKIKAFIPQEYWPIEVELLTNKNEKILAKIKKPDQLEIKTEKQAKELCDNIKNNKVEVGKFDSKNVQVKPFPPFITSTLAQSASTIFGWKPDKTMSIAQNLYTNGFITYHRTDSTALAPEFVTQVREAITSNYGSKYLPSTAYVYAVGKNAQEAHEACRVVDINVKEAESGDDSKLYKLIWKRSLASQMSAMEQMRASAEFNVDNNEIVLSASGSKVLFDGWRKVWDYGDLEDTALPVLVVGEEVKVIDVKTEQKFTAPPSRYSEASFNKTLESMGIGRPSTFAGIPKTLEARGYIKSDKSISVTDLGMRVIDFLVGSDFCFVNLDFTAKLEDKLDDIANNKIDKLSVLTEFWTRLQGDIKNSSAISKEGKETGLPCPKCLKEKRDGKLVKRNSKFGSFVACSMYKDKDNPCDYKADIDKDGNIVEKVKKEIVESDFECKNCNDKLIVRQGKKGPLLACRNWKNPACAGFYNFDTGEKIVFKKKTFKKWKKKGEIDE